MGLSHWWKKIWKKEKDENFSKPQMPAPIFAEREAPKPAKKKHAELTESQTFKAIRRKTVKRKERKRRRAVKRTGPSKIGKPGKRSYPNEPTDITGG